MLPFTIGSCHNLSSISKALRAYLNYEWQRKLEEDDVSSVPAGWAQTHPGEKHVFGADTMPGKSAQVPRQEDYCNCGLFVLAYMDFWTHAPPDQVELCERGAWKGIQPALRHIDADKLQKRHYQTAFKLAIVMFNDSEAEHWCSPKV